MKLTEKLKVALFQRYARLETSPISVEMTEDWAREPMGVDHIYTVKLEWVCQTKVDGAHSAGMEIAKQQVVEHFARTLYEDLRGPLLDLRYVIDTSADSSQRVKLLEAVHKVEEAIKP